MATIALLIRGAIVNAAAFSGGNYLVHYLSGDGKAALAEKTRHGKALEAYQAVMATNTCERTRLLDWIETNREIKDHAKQNFTSTDYAFKLYSQVYPGQQIYLPKEPQFSDFYQPSKEQKQGKLLFLAAAHLCSAMPRFVFCELSQS